MTSLAALIRESTSSLALVVQSALKHAVSVACNILLIGCAVVLTDTEVDDIGLIENL